ncbi:polysulfide reductase NrfD [Aestuariimicrobium sp. p3-SID1156]|uniref:NrfD/PsrC family molybdoenzyme membrane anchor subunit n=1 Tax=Aestuariimicrobium sp. p3-SID1156 TaxID=2916038 RepID=UPI00223B9208|nr:NrfD/PsrC family molybdoenzyme membrane anchor subunit [Aestuariimicrobium sp. p3-SID1156]MCT1459362.1 polysulfide reductase NrfD [Aestuariimicrobium sp. p3-SID1156]
MSTSPFDNDRGMPRADRADRAGSERSGGGRKRRRDGGRRGDPNATVPDVEFTSYYGRNVVKPAPWTHEIADYLFLGGLAAGSALIGAGASITGRKRLRRRARLSSLVAVGLGGNALIADLGRPERFLNMMRTVKLTSPMSVGSWILAGFSVTTGAATALGILRDDLAFTNELREKLHLEGPVSSELLKYADGLMTGGSAFFSPPLAAYTAVLLADTATPLWHQSYRELPFIFVSSGTAAGAGLAMITTPTSETGPVRQLAVVAGAADLVADKLLERRLGEEGQPLHEGAAGKLHTAAKALTMVGMAGAIVAGRSRAANAVAGVALLAGSACIRYAFWKAGNASAEDPIYTIRPQRRRAEAKRAKGLGVDQPGGEWPGHSGR